MNQKAIQPTMANPIDTTKGSMDYMEEIPGVHGDTKKTGPTPASGEMNRGIT
jgi:hypothetical protein